MGYHIMIKCTVLAVLAGSQDKITATVSIAAVCGNGVSLCHYTVVLDLRHTGMFCNFQRLFRAPDSIVFQDSSLLGGSWC